MHELVEADAGHLVSQDEPEIVTEALQRFLESLPPTTIVDSAGQTGTQRRAVYLCEGPSMLSPRDLSRLRASAMASSRLCSFLSLAFVSRAGS